MPEFFVVPFFKGNKIDRSINYPWLGKIKKDVGKIKARNFKDMILKVHKILNIS